MTRNGTKFEGVRHEGVEILRVGVSMPDTASLPKEVFDFYSLLSQRAKEWALTTLADRVIKAFEEYNASYGGRAAFFRRLNYLFECSVTYNDENFVSIIADVRVSRGGSELFFVRNASIWDVRENTILSPRRCFKLFCDENKRKEVFSRKFSHDGAFIRDGFCVFYKCGTSHGKYREFLCKIK
ncbi:MAG: hypothetical protein IKT56_04815 [Clostridia bacterium]|nr:hypothetical protein [Clostridia bacterium]